MMKIRFLLVATFCAALSGCFPSQTTPLRFNKSPLAPQQMEQFSGIYFKRVTRGGSVVVGYTSGDGSGIDLRFEAADCGPRGVCEFNEGLMSSMNRQYTFTKFYKYDKRYIGEGQSSNVDKYYYLVFSLADDAIFFLRNDPNEDSIPITSPDDLLDCMSQAGREALGLSSSECSNLTLDGVERISLSEYRRIRRDPESAL